MLVIILLFMKRCDTFLRFLCAKTMDKEYREPIRQCQNRLKLHLLCVCSFTYGKIGNTAWGNYLGFLVEQLKTLVVCDSNKVIHWMPFCIKNCQSSRARPAFLVAKAFISLSVKQILILDLTQLCINGKLNLLRTYNEICICVGFHAMYRLYEICNFMFAIGLSDGLHKRQI